MIVFGLASKYFVPMLMNKTAIDGLELNAVYFYIGFALRGVRKGYWLFTNMVLPPNHPRRE